MLLLQKQQRKVNSLIKVKFLLLHPMDEGIEVDLEQLQLNK